MSGEWWRKDVMELMASREQAKKDFVCNFCKEPILSFKDELSKKEYEISALCQSCQDGVFESFEEDPYTGGEDE